MMVRLYRLLTVLGGPLIALHLRRRRARGKEDALRFGERLGRTGLPRPAGPLVWLHAASVGESLSLLPLIERLSARVTVLVTTGTVTSATLMAERLPPGALHQYVPVDRLPYVRAFLDHWRPDLALWAESEFWPNLLAETGRRAIPQVLIQGRISPRSFAVWQRVPGFIGELLGHFALCLGQTEADAERLTVLGAREVRCLGNLKMVVPPLPCAPDALAPLEAALAGRPRWLAASTHPGEEAIAARVHAAVAARIPNLLTVVVPRHHTRGGAIAAELTAVVPELPVAVRSAGEVPQTTTALYLADTMGEMGLFYRLAPVVFVGKSLTVEGGQNPFEPATLGAAVLFGPRMSNFPEAARMVAEGAAWQVADEEALAEAVATLLGDPAQLARRCARAQAWMQAESNALEAVSSALDPFLAAVEAGHARA
ncbi:MAG: 3-deoxy-D-manno-octulosonic acid transferase [Magnetospirillum sp.]|nr:3-deoxy-D-manno-octulosonic acid transferase [Magnetospirillum sp.]